jgi:hypothetical protein
MPRKATGRKRWAIAEGYVPGWSYGPEPQMLSHETACVLNADDSDGNGRRVANRIGCPDCRTAYASGRAAGGECSRQHHCVRFRLNPSHLFATAFE